MIRRFCCFLWKPELNDTSQFHQFFLNLIFSGTFKSSVSAIIYYLPNYRPYYQRGRWSFVLQICRTVASNGMTPVDFTKIFFEFNFWRDFWYLAQPSALPARTLNLQKQGGLHAVLSDRLDYSFRIFSVLLTVWEKCVVWLWVSCLFFQRPLAFTF